MHVDFHLIRAKLPIYIRTKINCDSSGSPVTKINCDNMLHQTNRTSKHPFLNYYHRVEEKLNKNRNRKKDESKNRKNATK